MDNPDTLAALGTKVEPTNNIIPGLNQSAFEGQAVLVSYKTSVLVIVKVLSVIEERKIFA